MAVVEAIATTYLEADAASVTFSSIPATYEHLQIRWNARSNSTSWHGDYLFMQMGSGSVDTTSNYAYHNVRGYGTSKSVTKDASHTGILFDMVVSSGGSSGPPAPAYGGGVIDLLDYTNTNKLTTISDVGGNPFAASTSYQGVCFGSGLWMTATAVDTILMSTAYDGTRGFARGSEFTLYGLNSA